MPYTVPNTAFGSPNYGISSVNPDYDQIDVIGSKILDLQDITGAITAVVGGPSTLPPTVTATGAAGTGAVATVVSGSNDLAGVVSIAGVTGAATGAAAIVRFATRTTTPSGVVVSGPGSPYVTSVGATGFNISVTTFPGAGTDVFSYLVIG